MIPLKITRKSRYFLQENHVRANLDGEELALDVVLDGDEVPEALSPPIVDGGVLVEAVAVSDRLLVRAAPGGTAAVSCGWVGPGAKGFDGDP